MWEYTHFSSLSVGKQLLSILKPLARQEKQLNSEKVGGEEMFDPV